MDIDSSDCFLHWLVEDIPNRFIEFTHKRVNSIINKTNTIYVNEKRIRVLNTMIKEVKQKIKSK